VADIDDRIIDLLAVLTRAGGRVGWFGGGNFAHIYSQEPQESQVLKNPTPFRTILECSAEKLLRVN